MFEDFTFDQKVKPGDRPGLDSNLSPRDIPTAWNSPQAAPATLLVRPTTNDNNRGSPRHGPDTIESLTQQLSRQSLLSYVRSDGKRRAAISPGYMMNQIPGSHSTPIPSTPSAQSQPLLARTLNEDMLRASRPKFDFASTRLSHVPETSPPVPSMDSRSRLAIDTGAQSNGHNPRVVREALLEMMITRGVQCNVQTTLPLTRTLPPPPSTLSGTEAGGARDSPMADADRSSEPLKALEVDAGRPGKNDETAVRVHLRQAAAPSGIRRANGLRFPSSAEKALRSQNFKFNNVRMRKRDKEKSKPPTQMPTPPAEETFNTASS